MPLASKENEDKNPYFPIYVKIKGKPCLVVGGGRVAERKVQDLLHHEAVVSIVSPRLTEPLTNLAKEKKIKAIRRNFKTEDLEEAFIVIAATNSRETNAKVYEEAVKRKILVNVSDQPELCSFIIPAVVRRGLLQISISTGGKSPALAQRIREAIEEQFGSEYSDLVETMANIRKELKRKISDPQKRIKTYKKIVELKWQEQVNSREDINKSIKTFTS